MGKLADGISGMHAAGIISTDDVPMFLRMTTEQRKAAWDRYDAQQKLKQSGEPMPAITGSKVDDVAKLRALKHGAATIPATAKPAAAKAALAKAAQAAPKVKPKSSAQPISEDLAKQVTDLIGHPPNNPVVPDGKQDQGPRSGTVDRSTIAKTGTLLAGPNLDAQAKIDAAATNAAPSEPKAKPDAAVKQERTVNSATAKKTNTRKDRRAAKSTKRRSVSEAAKNLRDAKAKARTAVKADGPKVPEQGSMAEKIGKLASREQGASREELIKLSGWAQQAWKWYFVNSKDNGFCQKFGYDLKVIEKEGEPTRYKITKQKAK